MNWEWKKIKAKNKLSSNRKIKIDKTNKSVPKISKKIIFNWSGLPTISIYHKLCCVERLSNTKTNKTAINQTEGNSSSKTRLL